MLFFKWLWSGVLSTAGKYWQWPSENGSVTKKARINTLEAMILGLARVQVQLPPHHRFPQWKFSAIAYQESDHSSEICRIRWYMYGALPPSFPVIAMHTLWLLFVILKHGYGNELPSHCSFAFLQLFRIRWRGCQLISPRFVCLWIIQKYRTHTVRCFRTSIGRRANTNGWLLRLPKTLHKRRTFKQQIRSGVPNEPVLHELKWTYSYIQLDGVH